MSAKAWGIYCYLLSRPAGWVVRPNHLVKVFKDGRDGIYAGLNELVTLGLMSKETIAGEGARLRYRLPTLVQVRVPGADFPDRGFPDRENPDLSQYRLIAKTETSHSSCSPAASEHPPEGFDAFWSAYPRKVGKRKAEKAYAMALQRLSSIEGETYLALVEGASRLAADPNREDQFTPHPTSWLNRDGWLDAPLPEREKSRAEAEAEVYGGFLERQRARQATSK
jgi:hypothetical protein